MRSSIFHRLGVHTLLLACLTVPANAYEMFCPRANLTLSLTPAGKPEARANIDVTVSPKPPRSFPRTLGNLENDTEAPKMSMKMVDCGNEDFHCKLVTFYVGDGLPREFLLVVPHDISPGREYHYRGVRMITRLSDYSSPRNVAAAQVTLWQQIGDFVLPMELTVQPGRGLVFWDGVNFFPGKDDAGEMCALTSDTGLFRYTGVKLH
jgi:hypothetical protein